MPDVRTTDTCCTQELSSNHHYLTHDVVTVSQQLDLYLLVQCFDPEMPGTLAELQRPRLTASQKTLSGRCSTLSKHAQPFEYHTDHRDPTFGLGDRRWEPMFLSWSTTTLCKCALLTEV